MRSAITAGALALLAAGGCTTVAPPDENGPVRKISIERGPCFGFCPVYTVTAASDGAVHFEGVRHTKVIGQREKRIRPEAFSSVEEVLASIRPARPGTTATRCDAVPTDTPTVTIRWAVPGSDDSVLTYRYGCLGEEGQKTSERIESAIELLQIQDWASQLTREGASRG